MTTFAMNNLWTYLQGLSMTQNDMIWLRDRINQKISTIESETTHKVSKRVEWLHNHPLKLNAEDTKDEKTRYILSK